MTGSQHLFFYMNPNSMIENYITREWDLDLHERTKSADKKQQVCIGPVILSVSPSQYQAL